jgi:hypothetical protein
VTTGTAPYYAEAFFPMLGRCFRLIARAGGEPPGHADPKRLVGSRC